MRARASVLIIVGLSFLMFAASLVILVHELPATVKLVKEWIKGK